MDPRIDAAAAWQQTAGMNFRKTFRVPPDSRVRLADIDPGEHGGYSEAEAEAELVKHKQRISTLQRRLNAEAKQSLLIVLQGIDGAGKDGTCWHVMSAMDPQGVTVTPFKEPTAEEKKHDFLWRVHPHAPARGDIAVFNRSHYEDVLIARVHDLAQKKIWSKRYDAINDFEAMLRREADTVVLKFFLYISKEEQLQRFKDRLDQPDRQWKIEASDYTERAYWDDYIKAFEDVFAKCSTAHAPWFIIPSNHKWFRNLAVAKIIADTLEEMDPRAPPPHVDLAEIRKLYEAEAAQETARGEKPGKAADKRPTQGKGKPDNKTVRHSSKKKKV
jgi:PPK2 family polyphosphate:nucleotide phosphotransferase